MTAEGPAGKARAAQGAPVAGEPQGGGKEPEAVDEERGSEGGEPKAAAGEPGAAAHAEDPTVLELRERIAALEAELDDTRTLLQESEDRYLRLRAEFENFRRRTRQEVEQIRANAAEHLVLQLLPVVDNLERALAAAGGAGADVKGFAQGVEMVLKQFLSELSKAGVRPVEALGSPFDPRLHEAVMYEESDEAEGTVIAEFQKGYVLNDKVLRPSMVKVAKAR